MAKERPIVQCKYCSYSCRGKQALGRHVHYHHPEKTRDPAISVSPATLRGLLQLVDNKLASDEFAKVTGAVADAVRKGDVELHLSLLALAISKARRTIKLEETLDRVANALGEKVTSDYCQRAPIGTLLAVYERLEKGIISDAGYLQSILSMKTGGESTFLLRVVELLRGAAKGAKELGDSQPQLLRLLEIEGGINTPQERENFDKLISSVLGTGRARPALDVEPSGPPEGSSNT